MLLVEDNPDVATASIGLLEQLGYAVHWAQNAENALQELGKHKIDVVFSGRNNKDEEKISLKFSVPAQLPSPTARKK